MSSSTNNDCTCRITKDFDILRQSEVFSSAPPEIVKLFAYMAKHRTYMQGETIITSGERAECSYFLICGQVEISTIYKDKELILHYLAENSFLGELAMLARFNWYFTARASQTSQLLIIDRESFQRILEKYPEHRQTFTEKIIQLRINRFERQTTTMLDQKIQSGDTEGAIIV